MIRSTLSLAAALSVAGGLALADSHGAAGADDAAGGAGMDGMDHGGMGHGDMAMGGPDSAMASYKAVMETMSGDMAMEPTGDADADFLLMMIPHHQSAVDMARIVLELGDDPEVRALAEVIIESQEAEILAMREMLAGMGVEAPETSGGAEEEAASE